MSTHINVCENHDEQKIMRTKNKTQSITRSANHYNVQQIPIYSIAAIIAEPPPISPPLTNIRLEHRIASQRRHNIAINHISRMTFS